MTRWRDARPGPEQRKAFREAFEAGHGRVARMATILGLSRMQVYRLMDQGILGAVTPGDVVPRRDTVTQRDSVTRRDTHSPSTQDVAVTRTDAFPLTVGRGAPNLRDVDAVAEPEVKTDIVTVAIQMPRELRDRIELRALARKQSKGGRFAISPEIVELIERGLAAPAPSPRRKKDESR